MKNIWLAAAHLAKEEGYHCAAKLVECSILGLDYFEVYDSVGLFTEQIVTTEAYKDFIHKIKNGTYSIGKPYLVTHTREDNADLYYALHCCTYIAAKTGTGYKVSVYDLYDFALTNYKNFFTGFVSNLAWVSQYLGILNKVNVYITFRV